MTTADWAEARRLLDAPETTNGEILDIRNRFNLAANDRSYRESVMRRSVRRGQQDPDLIHALFQMANRADKELMRRAENCPHVASHPREVRGIRLAEKFPLGTRNEPWPSEEERAE